MSEEIQNEVAAEPQVAAEVTAETPAAAPDTSWIPKRISEITAQRRAAEARVAELEAQLRAQQASQQAAKPEQGYAPAEAQPQSQNFDQLARAYAEKMVREQTEAMSFNSKIASINEAGFKEFGAEYDKSVQNLQLAGVGGQDFLRVITSVPKAEALVTWLGKNENINDAMRIASLDPIQMGIELTKLSAKATKDLGKQISKAPPPIEPVSGSGGADGGEPDISDTQKWMAWRQKTKKSRR